MLSQEEIIKNKERFISLIKNIQREGSDIEGLINKLENSDFFVAPASTQYHSSFDGGLCAHSLNVYDKLVNIIDMEFKDKECPYNSDSLIITALLHDFSKMNFYESTTRNVKDENGNWTKVPFIKVKDAKDRFIYSNHGTNSEYMVGRFIPLMTEESVAIINHMGWSDDHDDPKVISEVYNRYSLALYLHMADCLATFTLERI
jgi:hypothetical protein